MQITLSLRNVLFVLAWGQASKGDGGVCCVTGTQAPGVWVWLCLSDPLCVCVCGSESWGRVEEVGWFVNQCGQSLGDVVLQVT